MNNNLDPMVTYTVLGNIRIQTQERLQKFRWWLKHARNLEPSEWIFKVRGLLASEAKALLSIEVPEKLILFEDGIDDSWFDSTLQMVNLSKGEFILNVVEDHFFVSNSFVFENIISEMKEHNVEAMHYGWFSSDKFTLLGEGVHFFELELIKYFDLDFSSNKCLVSLYKRHKKARSPWPHYISAAGIYSKSLYRRVLTTKDDALAAYYEDGPFNFERSAAEFSLLPIRVGVAKIELFACIDDDNLFPGTSLHSRGIYRNFKAREVSRDPHPMRVKRISVKFEQSSENDADTTITKSIYLNIYDWDLDALEEIKSYSGGIEKITAIIKSVPFVTKEGTVISIKGLKSPIINCLFHLLFENHLIYINTTRIRDSHQIFENAIINNDYEFLTFEPSLSFTSIFKKFPSKSHVFIINPTSNLVNEIDDVLSVILQSDTDIIVVLLGFYVSCDNFNYFLSRLTNARTSVNLWHAALGPTTDFAAILKFGA